MLVLRNKVKKKLDSIFIMVANKNETLQCCRNKIYSSIKNAWKAHIHKYVNEYLFSGSLRTTALTRNGAYRICLKHTKRYNCVSPGTHTYCSDTQLHRIVQTQLQIKVYLGSSGIRAQWANQRRCGTFEI